MIGLPRLLRAIGVATLMVVGSLAGPSLLVADGAGATPLAVTLFASPSGAGSACSSGAPCAVATAASLAAATEPGEDVTIRLAAGTYAVAALDLDSTTVASLSVVGTGTNGAGASVLDATGKTRVVATRGSPHPVSLSTLELTHGASSTGASCLQAGSDLTASHLLLTDCIGTTSAAAASIGPTLTAAFTGVTVSRILGPGVVAKKAAVTVATSVFTNVTGPTGGGGGIWARTSAVVMVRGSRFSTVTGSGGGIRADSGAALTVTDSTFHRAFSGNGGGIYAGTGVSLTVTQSTFSTDGTDGGPGGAIAVVHAASATVSDDTFVSDSAGKGSAIFSSAPLTVVTNDTFYKNSAYSGGALDQTTGTMRVTDATFLDNTSHTGPAGVLATTLGTVTVADSILDDSGCGTAGGRIFDDGYNVASTSSCGFGSTSLSASFSITLNSPLAANTSAGAQTLAIVPTSSAFEEVPSSACTVTTDERGVRRPGVSGRPCDAGAFEYQVPAIGYDLVGSDGGVFVFDPPGTDGGFYGSLPGLGVVPRAPIVGMVPTSDDKGYFLVGADGGVFAFGDAPYLGSLPGIRVTPRSPIVGIVAADTDKGYFLVGADGGVFAFGTTPFLGSLPQRGISASDIVGIASTPSGNGYWVVAATGKVYAFGAAQAFVAITAASVTSPVTAIAGTATGGGYYITTAQGRVFAAGNAVKPVMGTLPAQGVSPHLPIIGIVRVGVIGYWLIGADGGIFTFGTAPFIGSLPGRVSVFITDIVGAVPTRVG